MEHLGQKIIGWTLDASAAFTIYLGFINGSDLAVFFGMLASLAAVANHGSQWWERYKLKRKNKQK